MPEWPAQFPSSVPQGPSLQGNSSSNIDATASQFTGISNADLEILLNGYANTAPAIPVDRLPYSQDAQQSMSASGMAVNQQQRHQQSMQQQPSYPSGQQQQQQTGLQPLQAQATGTNPFARPTTATNTAAPLQVQATGTNPFRQSMFVNQQTGQGWQNAPQATMGGLEQLETISVFPRPGQPQAQQQQSPWG